jgi:hypothetical protein
MYKSLREAKVLSASATGPKAPFSGCSTMKMISRLGQRRMIVAAVAGGDNLCQTRLIVDVHP